MQVSDRICAIEQRAATINLSLWRLCKLANVDYGRLHRWRNGADPYVGNFERATTSLTEKLDELEDQMRAALATSSSDQSSRRSA